MNNKRVLFVCKKRNTSYGISYGLLNSCRFVGESMKARFPEWFDYKVVEVVDNNGIDREVHLYKPTHVIVEALWVVPEKFRVLCSKYENVTWNVRLHSKGPFLANEGIAMEWIAGYEEIKKEFCNFNWSVNDAEFHRDMVAIYGNVDFLPNIYHFGPDTVPAKCDRDPGTVDIGCFGAVRPLKNHLEQAVAAIIFADSIGKKLRFHVNSGREEQGGAPVLKNLRALFGSTCHHELVEHGWYDHAEFMEVVAKMDLGMQVSLSETFNIVAADFAAAGVPIIGSVEVPWMWRLYQAKPTETFNIVRKLKMAYCLRWTKLHNINRLFLKKFNENSYESWAFWLCGH